MTETPKCPYCGAEMMMEKYDNKKIYWYICAKCGCAAPMGKTPEAALSAALHRAEPKMRPLTPEEIWAITNEEDWNFMWLEHKESRQLMQICPWHRRGANKIIFIGLPFGAQTEEDMIEIGKTWRCWPRKPTPEQMAAAEWEE